MSEVYHFHYFDESSNKNNYFCFETKESILKEMLTKIKNVDMYLKKTNIEYYMFYIQVLFNFVILLGDMIHTKDIEHDCPFPLFQFFKNKYEIEIVYLNRLRVFKLSPSIFSSIYCLYEKNNVFQISLELVKEINSNYFVTKFYVSSSH